VNYVLKDRYIRPMMNIAYSIASLSFAKKKKVGAILLRDGRIVAQGLNGTVKGTDNCCEEIINGEKFVYRCDDANCPTNHTDTEFFDENDGGNFCEICKEGSIYETTIKTAEEKLVTKVEVLHAEDNLLLQCAEQGISTKDTIMVCTDSPCIKCAIRIAQCGIRTVYFERLHDFGDGVKFLIEKTNVEVYRISEDGESAVKLNSVQDVIEIKFK